MALFDDLKQHIGEDLGTGDWMEVTQEQIDAFAEVTDDDQWIHTDPERAKDGPFGTTIAHGYLTLSLLPALMRTGGSYLPTGDVKMAINYGLDRVRFITPVPSGGKIRAHRKLVDVTEVPGGVQTKVEVTVELDGAEKPACVAETLARFYT